MLKVFAVIIFVLCIISACENSQKPGKAVICGIVSNDDLHKLILWNDENTDTIFIEENKSFIKILQLNNPEYFTLKYGKGLVSIYIKPGDSIYLTGNNSESFADSVKFSGSSIAENRYLLMKKKRNENENQSLVEFTQLSETEYVKKADSAYQADLLFLEQNWKENEEKNEAFIKTEKAKILYTWAENLVSYEAAFYTRSDNGRKVSEKEIQKYLKQVNFNDSILINFFEYQSFFEAYLNMKAGLLTKNFEALADMDYFTNKITVLNKTTTNKKVKNKLLFEYFKDHINLFGIEGLDNLYSNFKKECTNKKYVSEIEKLYSHWKKLEPGNVAPDFVLSDISNKMHSISEFKGKMIYIDVWATWCAPCRREIPFVQKLYHEYKNKDIVFISISVDESKDAWKKMLEIEKPEWLQLHMEKGKSSFLEDYHITTIPRFILIDKEGKIINSQAPAASGDIRKLFNG